MYRSFCCIYTVIHEARQPTISWQMITSLYFILDNDKKFIVKHKIYTIFDPP